MNRRACIETPKGDVVEVTFVQSAPSRGYTHHNGMYDGVRIGFVAPVKPGDTFGSVRGVGVWTFVRWVKP